MRLTLAAIAISLLSLLPARAAEPFILEDFESGAGRWQRVEGNRPAGVDALVTITPTADVKVGEGAGRLRFAACPETWTHVQMPIVGSELLGAGCDRLRLWVKGDGSGEKVNVMFGNYERKPALCFKAAIALDFTGWREVVLPFTAFAPEGLAGALRELVLLQLNVSGTKKPVDVVLDDIAGLPAEGTGDTGRFYDLDVQTNGSWATPAPAGPVAVDRIAGMPPVTLPRTLHGVRNHNDLHNPTEFAVEYAEDGFFAVRVGDTSGYGGSNLLVLLDGKEVLRQEFPGETQTALKQYQGWYRVSVPAGKHVLRVDNDGNDWFTADAYRFGNYGGVGVRVRREDGALEVRFSRPEDAAGLSLVARVVGRPLPLKAAEPGVFSAAAPAGWPAGEYPVSVTAERAGKTILRRSLKMSLRSPHLRATRVAYPASEPVRFAVRYSNAADVPVAGRRLRARLAGLPLPLAGGAPAKTAASPDRAFDLADKGNGTYTADLGRLPAGIYEARVSVDGAIPIPVKIVLFDPMSTPCHREGLVSLGADGRFRTADGRAHLPWGFATIGIFQSDPEAIQSVPGEHSWCRVSDDALRDWMAMLRAYGINCVRFGVNVDGRSVSGDRGGHADPFIVERLRHLLDVLGPLGMRALPVLWWGHYRNFGFQGIPAYDALIQKQADWFTNPQALTLQQQYTREMVAPFKGDPRILAWEVMNETYRAGTDLDAAVRWTSAIAGTIREASPAHLITTSAAEATPAPEVQWMRGAKIDFFNWHAYPTYPDYGSYRQAAGEGAPREIGVYAMTLALSQRFGKMPSILGECGNDRMREVNYPEYRALVTRDCLWPAFLAGSFGAISWDAIADPREFEVLSLLAGRIDWAKFRPAPAPIALRVDDLEKDLGSMVRASERSWRAGVPIRFVPADEPGSMGVWERARRRLPYSHTPILPGSPCRLATRAPTWPAPTAGRCWPTRATWAASSPRTSASAPRAT